MSHQATGDDASDPAGGPQCFAVRHRRMILLIAAIVVPLTAAGEALVLGLVSGDDDVVRQTTERLSPLFTRQTELLRTRVGGAAEVNRQTGLQAENDLRKAELLAAPFTFLALWFVFRGLRPALLP